MKVQCLQKFNLNFSLIPQAIIVAKFSNNLGYSTDLVLYYLASLFQSIYI